MENCTRITFTCGNEVYNWIESVRGDVKRSTFVTKIVREEMNRQRKGKGKR